MPRWYCRVPNGMRLSRREGGLVPPSSVTDPADPATAIVTAAAVALNVRVFIGPLTKAQVAMLELLCSMLVRKGRFLDAALVYGALGCRRSGPGADLSVSLDSRVAAMQVPLVSRLVRSCHDWTATPRCSASRTLS
ncbi:hypothetical protein Vretimale_8610 [Volvox reticuliferus]|uniref:Uncharacterized protein n=1 Tax=Volvox reticuliferus TaxID=1737510 RepID=A0A8J4C8N9_9CHLO|nr:hypothetical protein Vretifemale_6423 [Volvox reticuliferus]GIM04005.1 hypothetical protein Vretimale_8610 [Volvox reticuliferus]